MPTVPRSVDRTHRDRPVPLRIIAMARKSKQKPRWAARSAALECRFSNSAVNKGNSSTQRKPRAAVPGLYPRPNFRWRHSPARIYCVTGYVATGYTRQLLKNENGSRAHEDGANFDRFWRAYQPPPLVNIGEILEEKLESPRLMGGMRAHEARAHTPVFVRALLLGG